MSRRRVLSGGMLRMLGNHGGDDGRAYRHAWGALCREHGPFEAHSLIRLAAARAAAAWATYVASARRLTEARALRRNGKGRRPSTAAIARLEKREGLNDERWAKAEAHVRELAGARKPLDLAQQIAAAQAQDGGR